MRKFKKSKGSFRILVLDDEPAIVEGIIGSLDGDEYSVQGTTSHSEAIELLTSSKIDMFITDFQMSPVNGDIVIENVRKFDKDIYILLLTGHAEQNPPEETFKKLDIQGYCEKGSVRQLRLWIESAKKTVKAQKQLFHMKEKLKQMINLTPELYFIQSLQNALSNIIYAVKFVCEVENAFIWLSKIENIKLMHEEIYKGIGIFNLSFDEFYEKYGIEFLNNSCYSEHNLNKEGKFICVPLYGRFFDNFGIICIDAEQKLNNEEILSIFSHQISASLENHFLFHLSVTDNLTGLSNRIFADNYIIKYMLENKEQNISVLMIDIDDFKKVNDTFGHQNGDIALITVAERIKQNIRNDDVAARFGGEEFVIILPNTSLNEAFAIAEKIRLNIVSEPIKLIKEEEFVELKLTVSIGVAVIDKYDSYSSLLSKADTALYKAKRDGKNRTCKVMC